MSQNKPHEFRVVLSVHCARLHSVITNKYTYYTNIFTLSGCYMFRLVAILRQFTTKQVMYEYCCEFLY